MQKTTKIAMAAALLASAAPSHAEIRKCEINGTTVYTDHACAGAGTVIETPAPAPATTPGIDPGIKALARDFQNDVQRRYAATVAANSARRDVPGVACPGERAIDQAIGAHEIALCMTPSEVEDAEPYDNNEQRVFNRLLPSGPSVVEWIYDPRDRGWPAVIRFNNNHVIGYSTNTPDYYRRRKLNNELYTD